jgi:hypothetical protein
MPVQDVMAHPWFMQDLHPDALRCNEALVAESVAHLPSPQMLQEVGWRRGARGCRAGCRTLRGRPHAGR